METRYGGRDDQSKLTSNKDSTYRDGTWLTSGNYTLDDSKPTLTSVLDGAITLLIQTENGKTTLYYGNEPYSHSYYGSAEASQSAREALKVDERATSNKATLRWQSVGLSGRNGK